MSNGNPYSSPENGSSAATPLNVQTPSWRLRLVELLVVVGIVGIIVALLIPARRTGGEAMRRTQCSNNLKQIALALQEYADAHGGLPPAFTVDHEGKPLHSWRTLVLPYLQQQALYDKIDLTKPWDDPANRAAFETAIPQYRCPSTVGPATHTTYLAVVGSDCCIRPSHPRALAEISDDMDLTLVLVEVAAEKAVHWMSPADANEQMVVAIAGAETAPHAGFQGVTPSCRVIHLNAEDTTPKRLRALMSISGGDDGDARTK